MAIDVKVVNNLGEVRGTAGGTEINRLRERARKADMRMLGCVDEYDDTYFNLSQMRLVIPELEELARSSSPAEAAMAAQPLDLAGMVSIHDRMIFVGD